MNRYSFYHLGFKYVGEWEVECDGNNKKIDHQVIWPDGRVTSGPWGSYAFPSENEFESFVESILSDKT